MSVYNFIEVYGVIADNNQVFRCLIKQTNQNYRYEVAGCCYRCILLAFDLFNIYYIKKPSCQVCCIILIRLYIFRKVGSATPTAIFVVSFLESVKLFQINTTLSTKIDTFQLFFNRNPTFSKFSIYNVISNSTPFLLKNYIFLNFRNAQSYATYVTNPVRFG